MGLGQSWLLSNHVLPVQCWEMVHRLSHQPQLYLGSSVKHPPQSLAIDIHLYTFTVMRKTGIRPNSHWALTRALMLRWLLSLLMIIFTPSEIGFYTLAIDLQCEIAVTTYHILCHAVYGTGKCVYLASWSFFLNAWCTRKSDRITIRFQNQSGFITACAVLLLVRWR